MASARTIALSTAVRVARRISGVERCGGNNCHRDPSTAVKQRSGAIPSNYQCHRDLSTAVTGIRQWPKDPFSPNTRHYLTQLGYTVDVADLRFTPERDFLLKNNGQKIKVDDLRGKTIVLFIVPLDVYYEYDEDVVRPGEGDAVDMVDAYYELQRMGSVVEFVFVPVRLRRSGSVDERLMSPEALFNHLFSTMPFPAIPFSDVQGPKAPVVHTFSVGDLDNDDDGFHKLPYWVVIDPTNKVMATRFFYPYLFKSYGGAELHPLSRHKIKDCYGCKSRVDHISKWDQLLTSDTRNFLLSSNGDKVPISSLKDKLVGLYFCENIPHPSRMQAIKKVYEEAKSRGYDFEIVQITFHFHPFNAIHLDTDMTVQLHCEDISWLTLPFKDPSCRKIHRLLSWARKDWVGDSLLLIYPCSKFLSEFAGAEILEQWGIAGYPFTRPSLYKAEYELQKREIRLQSLFPPGECLLRSAGDGSDLVEAFPQLSGKRVLVFFAPHDDEENEVGNFMSMLKSEYLAQLEDNVAEESKFEVVYVSTSSTDESSFDEFTEHMPWLVRPFSSELGWDLLFKVFKKSVIDPCAAAFNERGELIAKEDDICEKKEGDKLQFPFINPDLEKFIHREVEELVDGTDSDD